MFKNDPKRPKKKLDKEFQDKNKPLQEKLKREEGLGQWTYVVNGWLIDPLIRDRAQLMVEKKTEKTDKPAATQEENKEEPALPELPANVPVPDK